MRALISLSFFIGIAMALISIQPQAFALNVSDYIKTPPAPDWVEVQTVPSETGSLPRDESKFYKLVDRQQRVSRSNKVRYVHNAVELLTADGVSDESNFTISFDPTYETVSIHSLYLLRKEEKLDRLDLSEFEIYRKETDRDKLLYNGTLQASIILYDVQVGDILNYSYSISGKNEALGPHFSINASLQYTVPVQKMHKRYLIHESLSVNVKTHKNPPVPAIGKYASYNSYTWSEREIDSYVAEKSLPDWYYSQPTYAFSSFADWNAVGEYFAPKYDFSSGNIPEITAVAKSIMSKSQDDRVRARMALDYIHKNIRYTGINIGSGGYIPGPPDKTFRRKFGDCKDMTVLLLTILEAMNIEANAILVDTDYRKNIDDFIPSHWIFNHVLVRAVIDGKAYMLDGTRGEQLGDLDRLEQGSYGKGLLLESGKARLVDIETRSPEFYKDVTDTFELLSDSEQVTLQSVSTYRGSQADRMHTTLKNSGIKELEKNFLSFYQNAYADIEQIGEMEAGVFPELGKFTVTVNYTLGKGWTENEAKSQRAFEAFPADVSYDVPDFKGGKRTMPFAVPYPVKTRHVLVLNLDGTWPLETETVTVDNDAFVFKKVSTMKDGTFTQDHTYISESDHVSPDAYPKFMADIKGFKDELGVKLTEDINVGNNLAQTISTYLNAAVLGIIALIALIVKLRSRPQQPPVQSSES